MSFLLKTEIDKLSVMYKGDRNRDASSKIRGFLFQDFVTIMCLLQDKVEYVCSEFLEDIDIFFENKTFEFIQVKYYPKSSPNSKEILTDLYYQFLRLQMLHSTLDAKPRLFIHSNSHVAKPTIDMMKKYVGLGDTLPKTITYPSVEDSEKWLISNVNSTNKKESQKEKLFSNMASEDSITAFITKFDIFHQLNIIEYKEELMKKLSKLYPNTERNGDEDHWRFILLGLAISYIQRRYTLINPQFDQLRLDKKEFDQYMSETVQTKTEQTIVSYLIGIACEKYGEIINNNDLSELQTHMLNLIYQNTVQWINEIANTLDGQFQLLNTFSMDDISKVSRYRELSLDDRALNIAECKQAYIGFLEYLWKIILNICQEKMKDETEISANLELFKPYHYMDRSVIEYVCFNFPDDKYVSRSVILPRVGGNFNSVKRRLVGRMVNLSPKPGKWFFENGKLIRGKNYYNYSTADVNENHTVADLGEDSFYIECMNCIGIDDAEWSIPETCRDCIFSEKCVKAGE